MSEKMQRFPVLEAKQYCASIDLPYANFGLIVSGGFVKVAAPIAKWTVGQSWNFVQKYYHDKGAKIRLEVL